jgi:hypothetical protein
MKLKKMVVSAIVGGMALTAGGAVVAGPAQASVSPQTYCNSSGSDYNSGATGRPTSVRFLNDAQTNYDNIPPGSCRWEARPWKVRVFGGSFRVAYNYGPYGNCQDLAAYNFEKTFTASATPDVLYFKVSSARCAA